MLLKYFDLARSMVPDYMHCVLLGVVRQYLQLILSNVGEPYYVGNPKTVSLINNRLLSIRTPKQVTRPPRSIVERNLWKASEWRSWLIFYSLPCLKDILPNKYLAHLALLVVAINILLQKSISKDQVKTANELLIKFMLLHEEYYGKSEMKFNVHLLSHLCEGVLNWGPLWTHNAFTFEDENRLLLKLKKNPNRASVEVVNRYTFYQSFISTEIVPLSEEVKNFCQLIINPSCKYIVAIDRCTLIGLGKSYQLTEAEKQILNIDFPFKRFEKIVYNNIRYTTSTYKRNIKRNDSVVLTVNGTVAVIENIVVYDNEANENKCVLFLKKITCDRQPFLKSSDCSVTHIRKCTNSNSLFICEPQDLNGQSILINFNNRNYVCNIPYGCLGD